MDLMIPLQDSPTPSVSSANLAFLGIVCICVHKIGIILREHAHRLTQCVSEAVLAVTVAAVTHHAAVQPRVRRRPALTALERALLNRQLVSGERDLAAVQIIRITCDVMEASAVAVRCV